MEDFFWTDRSYYYIIVDANLIEKKEIAMIKDYKGNSPDISNCCFLAGNADVIGSVYIGEKSSIWYGTILRADEGSITIGKGSNIQDLCIVHVDKGYPVVVGDNVTVGHRVILHGAEISDNVIVGMGSIIMDGAKIGKNSIIGAGSLIPQGKEFPEGVLILGSPGKVIRNLSEEEIESIKKSAEDYTELAENHK